METRKQSLNIYSKFKIKITEQRLSRCSGTFIAFFEQKSYIVLLDFIVNFKQVNAGWVST